jgi:malate synthase
MPQAKKQDAGDRPLPQQRDERASGVSEGRIERLGDEVEKSDDTKLPHERDQTTGEQSTASATGEGNAKLMRQAKKDLESGKVDTDKGPVTDDTYHRLRNDDQP